MTTVQHSSILARFTSLDRAASFGEVRDALAGRAVTPRSSGLSVGRAIDWFMIVLSVAYLVMFSVEVFFFNNVACFGHDHSPTRIINDAEHVIWLIFVAELLYQVAVYLGQPRAERKFRTFAAENIISVVAISLPFLRVLRIFRVVAMTSHALFEPRDTHLNRILGNIAIAVTLLTYGGALAALQFEHNYFLDRRTCQVMIDPLMHPNTVNSFVDALQWSIHALSIGSNYHIYSPDGRWLEIMMNVSGLVIFGSIVGVIGDYLAKFLMEAQRINEDNE